MNYTEKYHLPQWEETDRIMRTDFNQMCADMETGLAGNREAARMDYRAFRDQLLRMAYNHYFLIKDMDPFPQQAGVFCRNVTRDNIPGTEARDGTRYMSLATQIITQKQFLHDAVMESELLVRSGPPYENKPAVLSFRSPMPGIIQGILTWGSVDSVTAPQVTLQMKLKNTDTGKVEAEDSVTYTAQSGSVSLTRVLNPRNFAFRAETNYQFIVEVPSRCGNGLMRFQQDQDTGNQILLYGTNSGCTVTHTFSEPEGSQDGLAFVRYREAGTGGTVTLKWNGRTVRPITEREITVEDAPVIRELIYRTPEGLSARDQLALTFRCNPAGELWFYEWGAILC